MYDITKLESLNAEMQKELDEVMEKWNPIISEEVHKQVPDDLKLFSGNGTTILVKDGRNEYPEEAEDFVNFVNLYQYGNHTEAAVTIKTE